MAEAAFDVVVVGGGVLGVWHAITAQRAGMRTALLERDPVARSASVRNFGMVWPIGQPAGPSLQLALRSRELWAELAPEAGFRCAASGSLHVANADDEWAVLREFAAAAPLPALQLLTPEAARGLQPRLLPDRLRGALFSPHEANVDPPAALAALHRFAASSGVHCRYRTSVVGVGSGVVHLADGSRCAADRIVLCSGDDFATLLPDVFAASDLTRCKLQMFALGPQPAPAAPTPMLAAGLTLLHYRGFAACPSLPALRARLSRDEATRLARGIHVLVSHGDDGRWIVGDSHEYGPAFAPGGDPATDQLILDYLLGFVRPPVTEVMRRWSGVYSLRTGGESVFRCRPLPGVEIVTGVGGSGMTRAPGLAEQTVRGWTLP
jgi:FAD dependent oxidoreductase TIGR03364